MHVSVRTVHKAVLKCIVELEFVAEIHIVLTFHYTACMIICDAA